MSTRFRLFFILIGGILVVATFTFPLWQPLLTRRQAQSNQEAFPGLPAQLQPTFQALPTDQQGAYLQLAATDEAAALTMANIALSPNTEVPQANQELPQMNGPTVATSGDFQKVDAIHWAMGSFTIYQQADNSKILRLESFSCPNGPDLHVILSASDKPKTPDEVRLNNIYLDLGQLQGNVGSQNYNIAPEVNLNQYQSVVIYSQALNMVYSWATMQ
jgi:electron transfer DM13